MKARKVGDCLWWAVVEKHAQVEIPCPVCYGKRKVNLILGNGDVVALPCTYCSPGYESPRGTVT